MLDTKLLPFMIFFLSLKGAGLKSFANATVSEVENEISEALQHSPKRKGGPRFKVNTERYEICFCTIS